MSESEEEFLRAKLGLNEVANLLNRCFEDFREYAAVYEQVLALLQNEGLLYALEIHGQRFEYALCPCGKSAFTRPFTVCVVAKAKDEHGARRTDEIRAVITCVHRFSSLHDLAQEERGFLRAHGWYE